MLLRGIGPVAAQEEMASACVGERGHCLLALGRLDEAAAAYDESIRRYEKLGHDRGVAVGEAQLGTVREDQRRYPEALKAYEEARDRFTRLNEPGTVAGIWHQTGMVYQKAGQPEAAEDAYRKSLAMSVQLGNDAGEGSTLNQLGLLYNDFLDRPEEAAVFLRQAVDKSLHPAQEGITRSNLAKALRRLARFDEARQEILRAIECEAQFGHASEPWKSWAILAEIETAAGNPAAAEAKRKAIDGYLAYRRDGGENHNSDGRICLAVTDRLLAGDPATAAPFLAGLATDPNVPSDFRTLIQALQSIVAGSRDHTLADAPGFRLHDGRRNPLPDRNA